MPHYNLNDVRIVARNQNIQYRGRNVQRDINNLGYQFADIIECILSLTEQDFHKTIQYSNDEIDDAYRIEYLNPNDDSYDSLYIKFSLINNYLMIDVASFHLNR
jgi:hypothetical protein